MRWMNSARAIAPAAMFLTCVPEANSAPPVETWISPSEPASAKPRSAALTVSLEVMLIAGYAYLPSRAASSIRAYVCGSATGMVVPSVLGRSGPNVPHLRGLCAGGKPLRRAGLPLRGSPVGSPDEAASDRCRALGGRCRADRRSVRRRAVDGDARAPPPGLLGGRHRPDGGQLRRAPGRSADGVANGSGGAGGCR